MGDVEEVVLVDSVSLHDDSVDNSILVKSETFTLNIGFPNFHYGLLHCTALTATLRFYVLRACGIRF